MDSLTCADGGLATTLQALGLPPETAVDDWVLHHPDRVRDAHRSFVQAGSKLLLTATFRALPSVNPRWQEVVDAAVVLARQAADGRAQVWGSIGPSGQHWAALPPVERQRLTNDWADLAERLAPLVDGLVLETFVDPGEACDALFAVRTRVPDVPVVVSLTPREDGRLFCGRDPGPVLDALEAHGASGVGFNCGVGPQAVCAAVERCGRDRLWVRPAGSPDHPTALADALDPWLNRCAVIGGCCGASPRAIAQLGERLA